MQRLETLTYDWRVNAAADGASNVSTNLAMVFLDDRTASKLETGTLRSHRIYGPYRTGFPIPRYIHGDFLDLIRDSRPQLICYDVLFAERRGDHPVFPLPGGGVIESDQVFADDIRQTGNVVLAMTDNVLPNALFRDSCSQVGHISAEPDFDGVLRRIRPRVTTRLWHEIFELTIGEASGFPPEDAIITPESIYWADMDAEGGVERILFEVKLNGNGEFDVLNSKFDFGPFTDEEIIEYFGGSRYHKPFEEITYWHLGFIMAAAELGLDLAKATELDNPPRLEIPDQNGLIYRVPLDADGNFVIRWKLRVDSPSITTASLSDFFDTLSDTAGFMEQWRDKLILIGSNATGNNLRDISSTPLSSTDFAMMTHLNVANSIIQNDYIRVTREPWKSVIFVMTVFVASLISLKVRAPYDSITILGIAVLYVIFAFQAFSFWNLWLPMALPVAGGLGLTHVLNIGNRALSEQKEKSRIRKVFGQTVSPNVVNVLLKEDTSEIQGSTETITTIFSDIRGFTDMTDSLESKGYEYASSLGLKGEQIDSFLELQTRSMLQAVNENLSIQAETIKIYNGTLDKYIGDCVMAFWGAPTADDEHALHCVQSTIASHKAMLKLNVLREQENRIITEENRRKLEDGQIPTPLKPLLDMGAGINSGKAIVGLIGSTRHISNYTVFGRSVNLAARLEATSGRGRIRIGETTRNQLVASLPDFDRWLKAHPPTFLKGFSQSIPTWEVHWWKVPESVVPTPEIPQDVEQPG